jgi:type IV secretion system protein VirD4
VLDLIHDSIALVTTAALAGPAAVAALFRSRTPTDESATAFGTARWATRRDFRNAKLLHPDGLVLGRALRPFYQGPLLRVKTDRHLLTLAATRSGKTVGTAIPNVLTFPGSVLVIDTKGEIAEATLEARRAMGHWVHVLDPWGITGIPGGGFNPFDLIDITHLDLADDAMMIADLLVAEDSQGHSDSVFWDNETRALLAGFILLIKTTAPPERQNCAYLRHLLTLPADQFATLLTTMSQSSAAHGLVARAANRLLQKPDRERASIISSAQSHTHFLDSVRLAAAMSASSLSLSDLRRRPTTIYLVLPSERLATYGRWLRLIVGCALAEMTRKPPNAAVPVLFLLDEFAALGRLEAIETAIGLMAGFGVQIWPIVQDLAQLKALYGDRWTSFIANAGVIQAFGINDSFTSETIANLLGSRTAWVQANGNSHGESGESQSANISAVSRPLLFPAELMRLPPHEQVLLIQGQAPIRARRIRWYADRYFQRIVEKAARD